MSNIVFHQQGTILVVLFLLGMLFRELLGSRTMVGGCRTF